MRGHYLRTVRCRPITLVENRERVVDMVGAPTAKLWRLYLVGGALAFEERRKGVDRILAVAANLDGESAMPSIRDWLHEMIRE